MKSPIKRVGGKSFLTKTLLNLIPPHQVYIEPFFGSGSLFFAKDPAKLEVINDLDRAVYNFFKVLQDEEKTKVVTKILELTPYSRDFFYEWKKKSWDDLSDIDRAIQFFIVATQSFSGNFSSWGYSYSIRHNLPATYNNKVSMLKFVTDRLKSVKIENIDAIVLLNKWLPVCKKNNYQTIVFLDPPYQLESRRGKTKLYACESNAELHENLLDVVNQYSCENIMFIITHFPSDLYERKLVGWRKKEVGRTISLSKGIRPVNQEIIWWNF